MASGIKVGSAYSTYELDISGLKQNVAEAKRLLSDLQATAQRTKAPVLGGGGAGGAGGAGKAGADLNKAKREADQAFTAFKRLETAYTRVRDSEIGAARAAGDHARALKLIQTELGRTATDTVRYNSLLAQQSRIQAQIARQKPPTPPSPSPGGGIGEFLGGAKSLLGGAGIALGAQQVISFTAESIKMANALEKTKSTVLALSGSQQRFNEVMEIARRGQQLYGGTLDETLRGLGSLVNLSNRTGTSLTQLDNVSRRLAVVDPVQGIEGANIALKEFLSGSGAEAATSLARRFELPKKAIAALAKEGTSAKDRLQALDDLLAKQGITQEVLANRANTTAATYDRLGVTIDDAKLKFGAWTSEGLEPAAKGLDRLIQAALGSRKAIAELREVVFREGQKEAERNAVAGQVDAKLYDTVSNLSFGAKRVTAKGEDVNEVRSRVKALREAMIDLSLASDQNADAIGRSLEMVYQGTLSASQFEQAIASLTSRQRGAVDVEDRRAISLAGITAAQQRQIKTEDEASEAHSKSIIETVKSREEHDRLAAATDLAARGLLGAGDQALILAAKYNISTEAARALIREQQRIGQNAGALADQRAGERSGGKYQTASGATTAYDADRARAARQRELEQARRDRLFAVGTPAQQLAQLQKELKQLAPGTADYERKYTEILTLQQQIRDRQVKTAKTQASEAQKRLNLEEKTADAMERQAKAAIDVQLSAIEDRRKRREEEKRVRQAQRVLSSPTASAEQKAAALDVLAEVPLLQQKRALEIASQQRDAGGTVVNGKLYGTIPNAGGVAAPIPSVPGRTGGSIPVPAPIAAPVPTAIMPVLNVSIAVYLDSAEIGRRIDVRASEGVLVQLQQGYEAARGGGFVRR